MERTETDALRREFGPAFWAKHEEAYPHTPPRITHVYVEVDNFRDCHQICVRFSHGEPLALCTADSRGVYARYAIPDTRQIHRFIDRLYAEVSAGFQLYLRWQAVRDRMLEQFDLDEYSVLADLAAQEARRLEEMAVQRFPEAARKIQEYVRETPRFREVFSRCHPRARPMFEPVSHAVFDADSLTDNITASEMQTRMRRQEIELRMYETENLMRAQDYNQRALRQRDLEQHQRWQIFHETDSLGLVDYARGTQIAGIRGTGHYRPLSFGQSLHSPYVSREEPSQRAWELLLEHLTPEQRAMLDARGYFEVIGGRTRTTYRINRGTQINIDVMDRGNRRLHRLCFQPRGAPATGDVMLAQKVMLELDEDAALAAAIRHECARGYDAEGRNWSWFTRMVFGEF